MKMMPCCQIYKSTKNAFCNYDLMMTMMKPCCQIYRAKMHFPIEILLGQAFFTVFILYFITIASPHHYQQYICFSFSWQPLPQEEEGRRRVQQGGRQRVWRGPEMQRMRGVSEMQALQSFPGTIWGRDNYVLTVASRHHLKRNNQTNPCNGKENDQILKSHTSLLCY